MLVEATNSEKGSSFSGSSSPRCIIFLIWRMRFLRWLHVAPRKHQYLHSSILHMPCIHEMFLDFSSRWYRILIFWRMHILQ